MGILNSLKKLFESSPESWYQDGKVWSLEGCEYIAGVSEGHGAIRDTDRLYKSPTGYILVYIPYRGNRSGRVLTAEQAKNWLDKNADFCDIRKVREKLFGPYPVVKWS